jgi:hypothetical protein
MALLSVRGISTPSLPAQGEQRRSFYFNIPRGNSLSSACIGSRPQTTERRRTFYYHQLSAADSENIACCLWPLPRIGRSRLPHSLELEDFLPLAPDLGRACVRFPVE